MSVSIFFSVFIFCQYFISDNNDHFRNIQYLFVFMLTSSVHYAHWVAVVCLVWHFNLEEEHVYPASNFRAVVGKKEKKNKKTQHCEQAMHAQSWVNANSIQEVLEDHKYCGAKPFTCGRDETAYLVLFGLARYI